MGFFDRNAAAGSSMARKAMGEPEPITRYPLGDRRAGVTVEGAIIDRSEQTPESAQLEVQSSRKIIRRCVVTLPWSVQVVDGADAIRADVYVFHGIEWTVTKVLAEEYGVEREVQMQSAVLGQSKPSRF